MKHAVLITAFNNFTNLNRLIKLLDDDRMVIFLHVDAQVSIPDNLYSPKHASLYLLPQHYMYWASVHTIEVTLHLLSTAINYDWEYCHYITENDLPLKSVSQIDKIFNQHQGLEFVDFSPENYEFAKYKCEVFHLFTQFRRYRTSKFLKYLNHSFARLQWIVGIRRFKKNYKHGSMYFSISREFASYLVAQKDVVLNEYTHTLAADEVWLQTVCETSPFKQRVANYEQQYAGNLRFIDWTRRNSSSPHTFQSDDYTQLIHLIEKTDLCFARKFDNRSDIAEKIYLYLLSKPD